MPDLRLLPDAPVPDGRTVLTAPDTTSAKTIPRDQATPAAFHTGYQNDRGAQPPGPQDIKTRGQFPTEDAARKLIYLAITRAQTKWRRAYNSNAALAAFKIHFGDRIPDHAI